jgi:beta-lactamase regulating signal transducer with metallopeptidase domain
MNDAVLSYSDLAWAQLWQVTIVAVVALAIVRLLCRRRPHLAYAVLLVVLFKCLTPPLVSSRVGLFSLGTPGVKSPVATNVVTPSEDAPVDLPAVLFHHDGGSAISDIPVSRTPDRDAKIEPSVEAHGFSAANTSQIGISIWAGGSILVALALAAVWMRQLRTLYAACREAGRPLVELHNAIARRLGIRRRVRLVISDANHGPLAFGVLRPVVVLPKSLQNAAKSDIEPLLAHELIHIRRGDTLVGPLQGLVAITWWFHPLVWIVNRNLSRHRERCCDEEVLGSLRCNPETYAQGLVHVLRQQRRSLPAMLASGVRPLDVTKERLELIMTARKTLHAHTPRACWLVFLLAAVLVVPGRGFDAAQATEAQQTAAEKAKAVQAAAGAQPAATLANPAPAARDRRREAVEFGPVIERTINDDNPQLGNFLIDLDKGTVMSPPADIRDEKAAAAWMAQQGIDAMGEGDMLIGFDIIIIPKAQSNWDPLRGNFEELNAGKPGTPVPIVPHGRSLPATYYFRTREGSSGVLQIVEVSGNATKIRYKLAKPDPAVSPASAAAEPLQDPAATAVANPLRDASRVLPGNRAAAAEAAAIEEQARNRQIEQDVRALIGQFTAAAKNNDAAAAMPLFVIAARNLPAVADYREIAAEGVDPGKIATVVAGGDSALAISEFFDSTQGVPNSQRRHCVVYTCQLKDGKWLISDIDLESVAGLVDEVNRFVRRSLQPQPPR